MPSIENWNSIGIDWNYPQLCTYYSALESIRLALVERAAAASYTLPTILQTEVKRLSTVKPYTDAIQAAITALIPLFINHTDNGGNWSGQSDVPMWTESAILSAIGAESRLIQNKMNVSADWITQQYKIINMLKWSKNINRSRNVKIRGGYGTSESSQDDAWNNAVSDYNSASWEASGSSDRSLFVRNRNSRSDNAYQSSISIEKWEYYDVINSFGQDAIISLYVRANVLQEGQTFYQAIPDITLNENKLTLFLDDISCPKNSTTRIITDLVPNFSNPGIPPPGEIAESSCRLQETAYVNQSSVLVVKYGFRFKDW